jgi:hypothetical protein
MSLGAGAVLQSPLMGRATITAHMLAAAALAILLAASARAQNPTPPDLSGTWTLNLSKSKPAKGNHIQSQVLVITYSGANIQFQYTNPGGTDVTMTYTADGKEHIIKQLHNYYAAPVAPECKMPPQEIYTKAQWKKSLLTVEMHLSLPAPCYPATDCPCQNDSTMSADRWNLSSDGRTLTRTSEAVQTANGEHPKQIFVYDKQ